MRKRKCFIQVVFLRPPGVPKGTPLEMRVLDTSGRPSLLPAAPVTIMGAAAGKGVFRRCCKGPRSRVRSFTTDLGVPVRHWGGRLGSRSVSRPVAVVAMTLSPEVSQRDSSGEQEQRGKVG